MLKNASQRPKDQENGGVGKVSYPKSVSFCSYHFDDMLLSIVLEQNYYQDETHAKSKSLSSFSCLWLGAYNFQNQFLKQAIGNTWHFTH